MSMEAGMQLALVKEGVEILDKGIVAFKKIEVINALDRSGALVLNKIGDRVVYELRTPKEKFDENMDKAKVVADYVEEHFPEPSV